MVTTTASVRSVLLAVVAGAVAAASYTFVSESTSASSASPGQTQTGVTATTTVGTTGQNSPGAAAPFTTADQSACLTWQLNEGGSIAGFEQTPCEQEHRFEVSTREDLAAFPSSEFGPDAQMPSQTRQAQLREELCGASTVNYLQGVYDPNGRYSIASILPPAEAWARGDRTMLCGLQVTDAAGTPVLTSGRAAEQDQARVLDVGQCASTDASNTLRAVDCGEPHHLEITSVVSLADTFPDHTPSVEEQDKYLGDVCTTAAHDYLGGEENLYRIALQPFWTTHSPAAWEGGSKSVNCALVFANNGQFATLTGSATQGREALRIDGNPPPERPERRPLREDPASKAPVASANQEPGAQ
ncbi:septum formation family protein [Corynebacterium qintianiae]|uniref:septum formation family protein n=1 Tax=Corynebacterium qintianiae TaxID=2709392 RepID=UPI0013EA5EE6|nr:septum formation family protein [Corynebacterium qintianiae]